MAKRKSRPLTPAERARRDNRIPGNPWLPIQPGQLPERLRKRYEQIPTGKPKRSANKRRKGGK